MNFYQFKNFEDEDIKCNGSGILPDFISFNS